MRTAAAAAAEYAADHDSDLIGHIKASACARQGRERHNVLDHCL